MKKILFVAAHRPGRSPSQRFRFEQYFDYLVSNGFQCEYAFLLSENDDRIFYNPGHLARKFFILIKSGVTRLRDVMNASQYDIVFIQREAFMTGGILFEKLFKKKGAKLVFDFDDAIWFLDVSQANKRFGWLKDPEKTKHIIELSDCVIAGNNYLADYAKQFNKNVVVIPTTIDTDEYKRTFQKQLLNSTVSIGWSGSITTIVHFRYAEPFLKKLKNKLNGKISIRLIGDATYSNSELAVMSGAWKKETEISDLSLFDIGIMPLPDDDWAKGKCGLKGLQYMALEIPAVMSPVGVNCEIIQDGVNGFLASSEGEWVEKISMLARDASLRDKIGKAARQTVVEKYSVLSQRDKYLNLFKSLTGN